MTTTSAVSGSGRPDRSGSAGIVALHSERRSKSSFSGRPGRAIAAERSRPRRAADAVDTCRMCATVVAWPTSHRETCATTREPCSIGSRPASRSRSRSTGARSRRSSPPDRRPRFMAATRFVRDVLARRADPALRATSATSRPTTPTTSRSGDAPGSPTRPSSSRPNRAGRPGSTACPTVSPSRSSRSASSGPASWPPAT